VNIKTRFFVLVLATATGALATPAAQADDNFRFSLTGRIVRVADGDTVTLLDESKQQHRIRLANIDAPETGKGKERPGQPYSQQAREALATMVAGKHLTAQCYEKDHYGRSICVLPYGNSSANREMVAQGMAWAYAAARGRYLRDKSLLDVERAARGARQGIWQEANPTPPWEWRNVCWKQRQCK